MKGTYWLEEVDKFSKKMSEKNPIMPLSIVERIFSTWTALRMTVELGQATTHQAHEFCQNVRDRLLDKKLDDLEDYIADYIDDYMFDSFNMELDDGSHTEVAKDILRFYKIFLENDADKLESEMATLPNLQSWILPNQAPIVIRSEEDETMKKNTMEVDEDGFTMVTTKRKK